MLKKIVACTLALSMAAGVLFGVAALIIPESANDNVTLCDLEYKDNGL